MKIRNTSAHKGFTLIELLVVIAIIGILSSVVLASLNQARSKGNDAAVKSNLSTIQTQAELYYDNNTNAYGTADGTTCTAANTMYSGDATIKQALSSADSANGTGTITCEFSKTNSTYAVAAQLTSGYWCIDSRGVSTTTASNPLSGAASLCY